MAMEKLEQPEKVLPQGYIYIDRKSLEVKVPESDAHTNLLQHLLPLLKWLYRNESWYFSSNLQIIQKLPNNGRRDITPDIAIFKGVQLPVTQKRLESWRIGQPNRPAPSVAFEIASKSTWHDDVDEKIKEYRGLGVKEYFAYDPNVPAYWAKNSSRLLGWKYKNNLAVPLEYNENGWLWSDELNTWLVPDGRLLQLYDQNKQRRLSQVEELNYEKREAEQKLQEALEKLRRLEQQDRH